MAAHGDTARGNARSARELAADVLAAVYARGAFAAAELDAVFRKNPSLSSADRGLVTELSYGVLRTRPALEVELGRFAKRGLEGVDLPVRLHLLLGVYQLHFLDRVPAYAAISEAVATVRKLRGPRVAGFCNALLRRCSEQVKLSLPAAIERSCPAWLLAELRATLGEEQALALLGAGESKGARDWMPTPTLRLRAGGEPPAWLADAARGRLLTEAYRVAGAGDLRKQPGYERGEFVIQDEGSMFAALALGARSGETVLDACAGRGQKSSLIAERIGPEGALWATDKSRQKLAELEQEFRRLRLPTARTAVVDWTQGAAQVPRDFDRVLVDAPCSGSGTLRRRPEILLRLRPNDVSRLAELAESILRQAARHARPGGRVVFVVCSVVEREATQVIERVSDLLRPVPFDLPHPSIPPGATHLCLLPGTHGTDGFFIASFERLAS